MYAQYTTKGLAANLHGQNWTPLWLQSSMKSSSEGSEDSPDCARGAVAQGDKSNLGSGAPLPLVLVQVISQG